MSFEENIRRVTPYTPGEQPVKKVIKLNTNECPYPPSPKVSDALKSMDTDALRLYSEVTCGTLTDALSSYYGVPKNRIFAGVGSDDVLSMCFLTFFAGKDPVLFPDITYSFYDVWASVYRIPYETIPLDDDFNIRPTDYHRRNGGVVIANPNAPTGVILSGELIEDVISHNKDSVVIVDEAYIDFGGESALPLIDRYDNLIVVRTMSKSRALAGMRIGYCFGNEKLIKYLNDVKYSVNSYTMNTPSLIAGAKAIEDDEYFKEITGRIIKTRETFSKSLRELGFTFRDSSANFVFAKPPVPFEALELFERLRERDIFVRHFKKPERISEYLRITIGTDEEMGELINALKEIMK
ncbi:MAG: histidinol-phosphate transaminase [Lachnospiraceae bacterium]|nr:histidinol-phosphate transaminase [Lachnospiraceae bacterium]